MIARRIARLRLALIAAIACAGALVAPGCAGRVVEPPSTRSVAWWWWQSPAPPRAGPRAPLVYVHVGTLDAPANSQWPARMPPAERYVLVWRSDRAALPRDVSIAPLIAAYARLGDTARAAGAVIAGMQVDIDVPTASLRSYGAWLDALRRALPTGHTLSVTGLLDWFRDGTAIHDVADAVDELVPQFYDVEPTGAAPGIAHPVDLATWTPRLEALRRPYRIGLATFGRIERVDARDGHTARLASRDLTPLDLAERFERRGDVATTAGRERVIAYRDPADATAGRSYQLIVPPDDVVEAGTSLAASCGPWCAGIAFFRWPTEQESLVTGPGTATAAQSQGVTLDVQPAACAPLWCADVWVVPTARFPSADETIVVSSSEALRMVQADRAPLRLTSSRHTVSLRVPAWHGCDRLAVGRLFTDRPARITLDAPPSSAPSRTTLARR